MDDVERLRLPLTPEVLGDDRALVGLLISSEFRGPLYEAVAAHLWTHAHRIILAWIRNGDIFRRCRAIGRPVSRSSHWSCYQEETLLEMADETVTGGLRVFCPAVGRNEWDARRGASLRTFFVNACVREFPNTYRWIRTREERVAEPMDIDAVHWTMYRTVGVALAHFRSRESLYSEYDQVRRALQETSPTVRAVVGYVAQGYTAREAADQLGTTSRAVESSLRRLRVKIEPTG